MDVSADLTELGRTPVLVVCAGAKDILDIPRTLEYLETQVRVAWGRVSGLVHTQLAHPLSHTPTAPGGQIAPVSTLILACIARGMSLGHFHRCPLLVESFVLLQYLP